MIEFKFHGTAKILALFLRPLIKQMERAINDEIHTQRKLQNSLSRSVRGLTERSGLCQGFDGLLIDEQGRHYPKDK